MMNKWNVLLIVTLWAAANTASAGEVLRFKAGNVETKLGERFDAFLTDIRAEDPKLYVVQWKEAVTETQKASLQNAGAQILAYIPDDAFLVKADRNIADKAEHLDFVRAVVPFHSGLKVETELTQNGIFGFSRELDVIVQTLENASANDIQTLVPSLKQLNNKLYVGRVRSADVWKLAKRADVVWIERFLPMQNLDMKLLDSMSAMDASTQPNFTGYESGTKIMNVDSAYAAGIRGENQLVAFADTGLDKGDMSTLIPDFQGQVKSGFAMGLGGKSWADQQNHGTHVAGSIAGSGVSSEGKIRGTAFKAKLVAEGLWSDILNNISIPGVTKLFEKAYSEGARIHSNSWGAPESNGRYDTFAVQADQFMFNNPDFLAVFAAGNDGKDLNKDGVIDEGSVSSPGSAKNVLTVGASKNYLLEGGIQRKLIELRPGPKNWSAEPLASSRLSEDAKGMAAFSSRGPAADGRIKPEIVAPGTNIVSARNTFPKAKPEDSWGIFNDHYLYMGGTSMATPLTSGAMALVRQYLQRRLGAQQVSAALLKATVCNTAEDLFPGQFGERAQGQEQPTRRPNNHEGWGRVNFANLIGQSAPLAFFADERTGLATGQEKTFTINVKNSQVRNTRPLRITLAYTDAPGVAAAAKALVNDLDLVVVDPKGKTYYPNGMSQKDSTNNMEQVDILAPVAGSYKVMVRGANIPQGKNGAQPYALVATGNLAGEI